MYLFLVLQKSPLDIKDCNGKTPLLLAASRLNHESTKVLYDAGADICAKDFDQSNFLHLAIRNVSGLDELWNSSMFKVQFFVVVTFKLTDCTRLFLKAQHTSHLSPVWYLTSVVVFI